ncbi:CPS1-Gly-X carboxypeptidase YSCS precursor [Fusarium oxysporum]|nr:CPS1-Gly-X carboxypeptidase YSCS precursor [Fusarium oxysporum]
MRFTDIVSTIFVARTIAFSHDTQHRLNDKINVAGTTDTNPKCHLPAPSHDLFSSKKALQLMVKKHQSLVHDRWKPFNDIPKLLKKAYPTVHKHITPEKVNKFGPRLHPPRLRPIPPANSSSRPSRRRPRSRRNTPRMDVCPRSTFVSEDLQTASHGHSGFGFDEECSGHRGAGHISKHLEKRYGEHGIAAILDEGGAGLQKMGDVLYALPAVYEKGYLDVWFNVSVVGGHSSVPTPHTAIGIMAEIVTTLEHNPFKPEIAKNGAIHQCLACFAEHSPHVFPDLTKLVNGGDLQGVAKFLTKLSRDMQYMVQTSQAIDVISGGQKINALPEFVTLGVNHREEKVIHNTSVTNNRSSWDIFAGTVRHSFAQEAKTVVAAPGAMTGNTDTRHYLNLSKNIYRWSPGSLKSFSNIHGVNERLLMSEQMNMARGASHVNRRLLLRLEFIADYSHVKLLRNSSVHLNLFRSVSSGAGIISTHLLHPAMNPCEHQFPPITVNFQVRQGCEIISID